MERVARRLRDLPAIHLLTGIGLILAVSLRDPLRDTLEFSKFAWGVALGCLVLAGAVAARRSIISASPTGATRRCSARSRCSCLLMRFGSGPAATTPR